MRYAFTIAAILGVVALPQVADAQMYRPPGRFELRLEPVVPGLVLGGLNGLQAQAPENGPTSVFFGINAGFGFVVTPLVEPGVNFSLFIDSPGGGQTTLTDFGLVPFLKLNLWVSPHVNPFFEPFAGFLIQSAGGSQAFFDGGMYAGVELLPANWGFRLWTGFEALVGGGTHEFGIPARWAFVVYF